MIITCNNCYKKFNLDSNLIYENGRLLQCNNCMHKWFFKNENINEPDIVIKNTKDNKKLKAVKVKSLKTKKRSDYKVTNNFKTKKISIKNAIKNNRNADLIVRKSILKNNYNILKLTIVFFISILALVIVLDTFGTFIAIIEPNIEIYLYNLYEIINDIKLFLKDSF